MFFTKLNLEHVMFSCNLRLIFCTIADKYNVMITMKSFHDEVDYWGNSGATITIDSILGATRLSRVSLHGSVH